MNAELLCSAVLDGRKWLDRFRLRTYEAAFREYSEQFSPIYAQAVAEIGGDETALRQLTEQMISALESGVKRKAFWNRSPEWTDCKQILVSYLSPMLIKLEEDTPGAKALCMQLRDSWSSHRPKDGYSVTSYENLVRGFRHSVLGIDLNNRHIDADRDR